MKVLSLNSPDKFLLKKQLERFEPENKISFTSSNFNKTDQALANYGKFIAFTGSIRYKGIEEKAPTIIKLQALRYEMKKEGIDVLLVEPTDDYLNEIVDRNQSQLAYLTGFEGEYGQMIVTNNSAEMYIPDISHLQAKKSVDPSCINVIDLPDGKKYGDCLVDRLVELSKNKEITLGYDPDKQSVSALRRFEDKIKPAGGNIILKPTPVNLIDKVRGGKPQGKIHQVNQIPVKLTGETTESKLERLRERLHNLDVNAMVVTELPDIAYLTNLRGKDVDYNAVFKSRALVTEDKAYVFCDLKKISSKIKADLKEDIEFRSLEDFNNTLKEVTKNTKEPIKIAFSPNTTNTNVYSQLKETIGKDGELKELNLNPIASMRSIKNPIELKALIDGCNKADRAVNEVIGWVNNSVKEGLKITEKDLEDKMVEMHKKHGATGLSFEVIPAVGENGAVIHYSHGDPKKIIKAGDMILLDTGGFYDAGYATDLTRTWLAGGKPASEMLEKTNPEELQKKKQIFSTVLKGALNGLMAELPPGARSNTIDEMVFKPIKEAGFKVMHSTGHGVGINVHEAPPYVSSKDYGEELSGIKEGMVFSIEPGIYIEGWGGVRIENLVTVVKHHDPVKAKQGWHEIKCFTFAPLDENLIDKTILEKDQLVWIKEFFNKNVEKTMNVKD